MAGTDREEMDLEELFAEARRLQPRPSDDLVARLLADAEVATSERTPARPRPVLSPAPRPRPGWLASLAHALGGWPALGGLAASTVLGLLLGVAQPAGLATLPAALWGEQVSVSLGLDVDPLSLLEG